MSLAIPKTHKLYIGGAFPRSESGRSYPLVKPGAARPYANLCLGSRKDLRAAVEAAKGAQHGWAARSAYNRGQILYRMAEMIEGRAESWQALLRAGLGLTQARAEKALEGIIDDYRFVGLNQFSAIQSFLDQAARKVGKRISLRIQLGSFDAVCRMVAAGVGLAIVPLTCAQRLAGPLGLKLIPLEDAWARRDIRLVKRAGRDLPQFGELLIRYLVDATAVEARQA